MHAEAAIAPDPASAGRILLVDDDVAILRGVQRLLEMSGFAVHTADDGAAAIEALEHNSFDAVVSDITMPRVTGIELLKAIRGRDLDVPVLLMTAAPHLDTALVAIQHGVFGYLPKPFDARVLQATVTKAVRLHKLAQLKRQAVELTNDELLRFGDRLGLEAAFDRALASLWMAFQPIVSVSRGQVVAYEALMRGDEPTLPNPGVVLRAAERLGRVHDLSRTVRARVAEQLAAAPPVDVFVNLHGHDLLDETLYARDQPLSAFAARVVLEITERASLDEVNGCEGRARELRRLGFRLAVDDLGAGYAGLNSFAQLEPDVVKFDMSLVRGIDQASVKRQLVGSMAALFAQMGTMVVAEGVETESERDTLAGLGCDNLQGYLFARPGRGFPAPRL
jgi:EAL domain-containing protein (putative c-di-GMP-specific phosphodiesterase class I)/CheY-like chemotaxis protein